MNIEMLSPLLDKFVSDKYGGESRVVELRIMEAGHAGLTNGFNVVNNQGETIDSLIMKMAPIGVKRQGSTDVYRQAPLLKALHKSGFPVPDIRWASDNEDEFGTPYIMMECLEGREFFIWEPDDSFEKSTHAYNLIWQQAVELLAAMHCVDWQAVLPDWEEPRSLLDELSLWERIMRQSPEAAWVEKGEKALALLRSSIPDGSPLGIIHGDFQPGNILYQNGIALSVVDWDISGIGSRLSDIGWIMTCLDREAWHADYHPVYGISPDEARGLYEDRCGHKYGDIPWYHAFASFRFAAISCQNLKLHRRGQRHDPIWEKLGLSVPSLFDRSEAILQEYLI